MAADSYERTGRTKNLFELNIFCTFRRLRTILIVNQTITPFKILIITITTDREAHIVRVR